MPFDTLTRKEAASRVRMGVQAFDKLIKAGAVPATRVGRRVLVRTDVLQAYLERCTDQPQVKAA